jgi:hypothetical protein
MVFFNINRDSSNNTTFSVARQWWYFLIVTVPLSVTVFAVWAIWCRQREANKGLVDAFLEDKSLRESGRWFQIVTRGCTLAVVDTPAHQM